MHLASDVMWREVVLAKNEAKPVVLFLWAVLLPQVVITFLVQPIKFMQKVALLQVQLVYLDLIPNMKDMFNEKLGINIDVVNTNKYSDGLTTFRPLKEHTETRCIKRYD